MARRPAIKTGSSPSIYIWRVIAIGQPPDTGRRRAVPVDSGCVGVTALVLHTALTLAAPISLSTVHFISIPPGKAVDQTADVTCRKIEADPVARDARSGG